MQTLHKFYSMSDQEVIVDKSSILFSKNVTRGVKMKLLQISKFKETNQFRKYLCVSFSGKALKKMDYQYIME